MSELGLEDLPPECLAHVFGFLKAEDVVGVMLVSPALRDVAGSESVWRRFAWKDFGIYYDSPSAPRGLPAVDPHHAAAEMFQGASSVDRVNVLDDARRSGRWRRLYAAVRSRLASKTRVLRVQGLFTDGGVDENTMDHWVGNMFNLDKHENFYCSAASVNINCVGCIKDGDADAAYAFDAARRERRRYIVERCNLLALVLEALRVGHLSPSLSVFSRAPSLFVSALIYQPLVG